MLATSAHIGTKNLDPHMARYIYKRRNDGTFLINLQKTWEKIVLAARIIVAIENPADVCAVSARPYGQRAVLKFAKYTGAQAIAGRYTPGTFTNQSQDKFMEPRLLILTDPHTDHQPIRESAYSNIPTIAFCHTDSPVKYVDVAIPCNNKGKHAIGLMWWLLTREVLYLRNAQGVQRGKPWEVMPDLFFYREPEEIEKQETEGANLGPTEDQPIPGHENWDGHDWPSGSAGAEWGQGGEPATWDSTVATGGSWDPQE